MFWGLFSWEWGQAKQQVGYQESNWMEMQQYVRDLEDKARRLEQEVWEKSQLIESYKGRGVSGN